MDDACSCTFSVNCLMTDGGSGGRGNASIGEGSDGPGIITKDATFSNALCEATSAARRLKPEVYVASACTPWPPSFEKLPTRKMRSWASEDAANVDSRVEKNEVRPVHTRSESSQRSLKIELWIIHGAKLAAEPEDDDAAVDSLALAQGKVLNVEA